MTGVSSKFLMFVAMVALTLSVLLNPGAAQAVTDDVKSGSTCTDFKKLMEESRKMSESGEKGILTNISDFIKTTIGEASKKLFETFTKNDAYKSAVIAAMTLMVVIYGAGFLIGVIQPSFGQVLIRLMKMGIIFAVISPDGWEFFSQYVVKFFNDGTDQLIGGVMEIGMGQPFQEGDSPFKALDALAKFILSPDMIIAILGTTFASGPYGLTMGALLAMAVGGLLKMIIEGLKLYALAFVMRALLLGVAPIFFIFLLFEKTKQMFMGWVNTLINLSLQPILYFTFISFFMVMITTAAFDMLGGKADANGTSEKGVEFCWVEYAGVSGSTNKKSFWRIMAKGDSMASTQEATWAGPLSCVLNGNKTKDGKPCPAFPINIVDLLSFLILIYVAQRFSQVITRLASEISSAFVNLDTQGKLEAPKGITGDKEKEVGQGGQVRQPTVPRK